MSSALLRTTLAALMLAASLTSFAEACAAASVNSVSEALTMDQQAPPTAAPTPAPAPKERVAAVKKSFAESQAKLRSYEWIETTATSLKDEEKARTQNRCYYGAEGRIQKVPVVAPPEEKPARGLRGKIKEKKKEELSDYMQSAVALVHKYLPPDQEKLQKCADAGKASIHILDPGKRARLEFQDYLQPGDKLSVEIDLTSNTILGVGVSSALGEDKDPVTLEVKFDKFDDGTIYTSETKLEAKAKQVKINVQNSGYRKTGA
jgi:hypothetical protein